MAVYGYWRCSDDLQDKAVKVIAFENAGCEKIYTDKITGGCSYGDTAELSSFLEQLNENDLLVLEDLSTLGRTMVSIFVEVNKLIDRGVFIKTLDGRLDTSLMNDEIVRLIVGIMGYAAECELDNIKQITAKGRAIAKTRGVKFGAKRKFNQFQIAEIMYKRNQGEGYGTIAKALGMKRSTVQKIVQREGAS